MNGLLLGVAYLAVLNPPRTRLALPETPQDLARPGVLAVGSLVALAGLWALAGWSGPVLDALQITPETFRLAAGIVAGIAGLRTMVVPRPSEEPVPEGRRAALWPVAFPRLLTPEVVALALTTGSQEGAAATLAAAACGLVVVNGLGLLPRRDMADRVLLRVGRLISVLLMIVAVFLVVDGIRDV